MEDLLDKIIGEKQSLEGGFGPGTPLRRFKGKLAEIATEEVPFKNGKSGIRLIFKFSDVEVILTEEPYDLPIAEVRMLYFTSPESDFGVWYNSYLKFSPDGILKEAVGKVLEVAWTPNHDKWDSRIGKAVPQDAWEILGIEGMGGNVKTAREVALEILNGRTLQEFNKAVLADPVVRSDSVFQTNLINKSWVKKMLEEGVVSKDGDDVFHVSPIA